MCPPADLIADTSCLRRLGGSSRGGPWALRVGLEFVEFVRSTLPGPHNYSDSARLPNSLSTARRAPLPVLSVTVCVIAPARGQVS
eukprot:10635526-Karenia_brevis.AAC.1